MTNRIRFFYNHLFISILIIIILLIWVFFVWYPQPLFKAVGVLHIILLLVVIDVILGPLLGLFVYKDGKKTLKVDLFIIVCIQVLAFGYGVWTIAQGRPAWIVFNMDRFDAVRVNELDLRDGNEVKQEYRNPSLLFPNWVSAVSPTNTKDKNKILFETVFSGIDISQKPILYHPLSFEEKRIKLKAIDLNELYKFNNKNKVQNIIEQYAEANAYLPLKANAVDMTVLINRDTADIIRIVDLRPWK